MRQSLLTDREIKDKNQDLQRYLVFFGAQLSEVMAKMPVRGIMRKDGTFEFLPPAPEWQALIDKLQDQQTIFFKSRFPEFYADI
jgi:hypothetical protein